MNFPEARVPYLSAAEMAIVDRLMVEEYGISLPQMMENAGRNLARLAWRLHLRDEPQPAVLVLAGSGGNGGGALVAARYLHNLGAAVSVRLSRPPERLRQVPRRQYESLSILGVPILHGTDPLPSAAPALIIDGLLGYSLAGAPRGEAARLITWTHQGGSDRPPILALDLPSGLEPTSGRILDPAIRADATLTLALPKTGLANRSAAGWVGDLYLADIGVPPDLYAHPDLGLEVGAIFAVDEIVRPHPLTDIHGAC